MNTYQDILKISEEEIENNISETLEEIGYSKIEPFNNENLQDIINLDILESSLKRINNNLEEEYIIQAIKEIKNLNFVNNEIGKYEGNSQVLDLLKSGIYIKIPNINQGRTITVNLIDYKNIDNNKFNYCRQLNILDNNLSRFIPDIIIYINGLPLSIFEIKTIESNDGLIDAAKQLNNYVSRKYELFWWNIISVVTNSYNTQIVDLQNNRVFNWRNPLENNSSNNFVFENDIKGLFKKETFLKIIKNYIHYANKNSRNTKFVPRYHQFVCCEKCFASLKQKNGNKCGFVWHTQGSGKTITMLFLAKQIMQMETSNKYKIVFVTDRNSLDNQLFTTFKSANKFLNLEAKQINSRDELIDVLSKDNNPGIYMTTIQKFFEKTNVLSKKENIIVIADEAHRSHNNIEIDEIYDDEKSNFIIKKGYAYFLREAFPNAKFIGFTGTPLIKDDKTKEIFGDIIDKYTMEQAEIDAAVVPIKYQKNTIQRTLKEDAQKIKELDEIYQNETENEMRFISQSQKAKIRTQLNNFYKSYSDPKTINTIVTKFWFDYNQRKNILHGKAMFVAFNRQVAVKIYKEMISQNPEFKEKIKLIISNSNKDSEEILEITRNINEYEITGEFKNPDSKIKILVVVDKLLTGYDVPDLDTIYIFKVIKFHNLMQTVARVNRTYSDNKNKKEYGLVVDYIGIAQHLEQALIQYSNFSNDSKSDFNIEITITKLKDSLLEIRKEHFLENNIYQYWMIEQDNAKRIDIIKDAINHIGKLDSDIKNNFLEKISKINKWYKVCVQKLDSESKKEFYLYNTIFRIIRKSNVEDSIDLTDTLEKLKNKLSDLIEVNNVNFEIVQIKNLHTLSEFSKWIENKRKVEKSLFSETDKIQVIQEIREQIKKFRNIDPIESQKLSESLKKYIDQLNKKMMTMDEFLDELEKFLEFMMKQEKNADKLQDKKWLLPFFNILVKPEIREKISKNSDEELVELVYKIWQILEKYIDKRWFENNSVRSKALYEISTMLYKEYNYPPNDPTNPSNLIIDELSNNITIIKKHRERIMYDDKQRNNN